MITADLIASKNLSSLKLDEIRNFLETAYEGDFMAEDFEHCLGGVHALVYLDGQLVGHGAVIPRQLMNADTTFEVGYVEAVATHLEFRRTGIATAVMEALEKHITNNFNFGALSTGDEAMLLYQSRGWITWTGKTGVMRKGVSFDTPEDDGGIYLFGNIDCLDSSHLLLCQDRPGDAW